VTSTAFDDLPRTPLHHFQIHYFAAASRVLDRVAATFASAEAAFDEFPFLAGYAEELGRRDIVARTSAFWESTILEWERGASTRLPLRVLREAAALDCWALTLFFCIGLTEEDARFGLLFEALQSEGVRRPTLGLLNTWWREPDDGDAARVAIRRLGEAGVLRVTNPEAPRVERTHEPVAPLWDALRGQVHEHPVPWMRHQRVERLASAEDLVLPDAVRATVERLLPLLERGEIRTLIVRGPNHCGRRTLVGALARALGRGVLEAASSGPDGDERMPMLGAVAAALHALPLILLDPRSGETVERARPALCDGPLAIVLGRHGGVSGSAAEDAITIALETPSPTARRLLWSRNAGGCAAVELDDIAVRFRLTSGNLLRAAERARDYAALAGRAAVTADDVRRASRDLNREALDTLATYVETRGDFSQLALTLETRRDLADLERRCRYRERLPDSVVPALAGSLRAGVRALFRGPSGTGKTLAAGLLAEALHKDLYRVDLATVVNKYIGETEKNLSRLFSLAEELDVILLFDEGDALLSRRTSVQTSNDRYANLETNYLLQRIESFEGILLLTTNAGDNIDAAFQRRMDVVIDFRSPEPKERWAIWQGFLPGDHTVDPKFLRDVASRCSLSGGQIRNAVLHAAMLALDDGGSIQTRHLEAAVQREYRKSGGVCPLRRPADDARGAEMAR
jgi:DNA polymerase III delta prime subunit